MKKKVEQIIFFWIMLFNLEFIKIGGLRGISPRFNSFKLPNYFSHTLPEHLLDLQTDTRNIIKMLYNLFPKVWRFPFGEFKIF